MTSEEVEKRSIELTQKFEDDFNHRRFAYSKDYEPASAYAAGLKAGFDLGKELESDFMRLEYERDAAASLFAENQRRYLAQIDFLLMGLAKIAEAERMGYGTQRTYGQMAQTTLDKYARLT